MCCIYIGAFGIPPFLFTTAFGSGFSSWKGFWGALDVGVDIHVEKRDGVVIGETGRID